VKNECCEPFAVGHVGWFYCVHVGRASWMTQSRGAQGKPFRCSIPIKVHLAPFLGMHQGGERILLALLQAMVVAEHLLCVKLSGVVRSKAAISAVPLTYT